ncbi:NAD(P)-dependent oxidoreductase [Candidatus Gottesmanbacteria bacterium]|nr:NAD(P)-dependent oxidoreductase [Candidatus Gottesmanbacteria bacterium]
MILITGGAGYIGSVLVKHLLNQNYKVRVIDSFWFGKESLAEYKNKIEIVEGDIRNPPKDIFKNIDSVIHLAGFSNDPTANFDTKTNFEINTYATLSFAKQAKSKGVKQFIFGSSCSIYDQGFTSKIKTLRESDKVFPKSAYSLSKYQAEQGLLDLASNKFCVVVVRKGTVYGYSSRMRYDLVINTMVKDALSYGKINVLAGGVQFRPLISVDDVARGYILFLKQNSSKLNKNIFNLLSNNFRIIDVAKIVKKSLKKYRNVSISVSDVFIETRNYKVSNKKIKKYLNFKPVDNIESIAKDMIKKIYKFKKTDFDNFNYYNIEWMKRMYEKQQRL